MKKLKLTAQLVDDFLAMIKTGGLFEIFMGAYHQAQKNVELTDEAIRHGVVIKAVPFPASGSVRYEGGL